MREFGAQVRAQPGAEVFPRVPWEGEALRPAFSKANHLHEAPGEEAQSCQGCHCEWGAKGHRLPRLPSTGRFTPRPGFRLLARQCSYFSYHTLRCWETVKKKKINQPCDLLHKPKTAILHGPASPSLALALTVPFHLCCCLPGLLGELGRDMTEPNSLVGYSAVLLLTRSGVTWTFLTHASDPVCFWSLAFDKMRVGVGCQAGSR